MAFTVVDFFSGMYTESLYLLLSLMSIYFARRERWLLTGLAGFLAGLARPVGFLLFIPLLVEAYWQMKNKPTLAIIARLALACLPVLAFVFYISVVGWALNEPTALFIINATQWNRSLLSPLTLLSGYFTGPLVIFGWDHSLVDMLFFAVFGILAFRSLKIRRSYGLYAIALLLFPALTGSLQSMPRYAAVAFPVYLELAQLTKSRPVTAIAILSTSALVAIIFVARFVTWNWVA